MIKINNENKEGNRTLICSKKESGMFYCAKKDGVDNTPTSEEFIRAVEQCKTKNIRNFLKMHEEGPVIVKYLSRRKIEVDKFGIPILNEYEANLYYKKEGIPEILSNLSIPYRTIDFSNIKEYIEDKRFSGQKNTIKRLARAKQVKYKNLHPINLFNIQGPHPGSENYILLVNSNRFEYLKDKHKEHYKGLHYSDCHLKLDFLGSIRTDLDFCSRVKFDDCPYNIILRIMSGYQHSVLCVCIVDTNDIGNPKLKKIIGFNSWKNIDPDCPIEWLKRLVLKKTFNKIEKKVEVMGIYYGAQGATYLPWETDGHCTIYAINALNAMTSLLIDKESFTHKILMKGETPILESNFKEKLLYTLGKLCAFSILLCCTMPSFVSIPYLVLILKSLYYTYKTKINEKELVKTPENLIKMELKQALPQYFREKDGRLYLRNYKERLESHIKDCWLFGGLCLEKNIGRFWENTK